jgi:hypothetical protein
MVSKYGAKKWSTIAQALPGRIGKQCRERYVMDFFLNSFIKLAAKDSSIPLQSMFVCPFEGNFCLI